MNGGVMKVILPIFMFVLIGCMESSIELIGSGKDGKFQTPAVCESDVALPAHVDCIQSGQFSDAYCLYQVFVPELEACLQGQTFYSDVCYNACTSLGDTSETCQNNCTFNE